MTYETDTKVESAETRVFKAQSVGKPIPNLTIVATDHFPAGTLQEARDASATMGRDAFRIAEALHRSLPQGTLDLLLAELVRRHASQLVVRLLDRI